MIRLLFKFEIERFEYFSQFTSRLLSLILIELNAVVFVNWAISEILEKRFYLKFSNIRLIKFLLVRLRGILCVREKIRRMKLFEFIIVEESWN